MNNKGATEVFATALMIIVSVVVFMITLYFIFNYFLSFSMTVSLHEMDRKMNDYAENMLSNCSLLRSSGVFDAALLNSAFSEDPLREYCYRYCEYGTGFSIVDHTTNEKWDFGYSGEKNVNMRSSVFKVGIYNERQAEEESSEGTTTTTVQSCPSAQENCGSYSTEEECENNCCAWHYSCSSCEDLAMNGCNYVNYYQGVCEFDMDSNECAYLSTPRKREDAGSMIHPGEITINIYSDLLSRISCEAEKAGMTGNRKMLLERSNLPDNVDDRKVTIEGLGSSVCTEMPSIAYSSFGVYESSYYTQVKFCRKTYNSPVVTDGALSFALNEDMNLTFTKNAETISMGAEADEANEAVECLQSCGSDPSYAAGAGCGTGCSCYFPAECSSGNCRIYSGESGGKCE